MEIIFEWNKKKEELNYKKHGINFEEAKTIFYNPLAKIFDDETHSFGEKREIIIGHSLRGKLMIVIFTERKENTIRIISARYANKKEQKDYEDNKNNV